MASTCSSKLLFISLGFDMKFSEIKKNNIAPFETKDNDLRLLFSYFLHKAPTINSNLAIKGQKNDKKWNEFIKNWKDDTYRFYSSKFPDDKTLEKYKLSNNVKLVNKDRAFLCLKTNKESDYKCFARHLRNSIAHGYVYAKNTTNRIYLLFEDYNKKLNLTAIILISKQDLIKLRTEIKRDI